MNIEELKQEDVGRMVVYTPYKGCNKYMKERGVIIAWNDKFIFVKYENDTHSKATYPIQLEFAWK